MAKMEQSAGVTPAWALQLMWGLLIAVPTQLLFRWLGATPGLDGAVLAALAALLVRWGGSRHARLGMDVASWVTFTALTVAELRVRQAAPDGFVAAVAVGLWMAGFSVRWVHTVIEPVALNVRSFIAMESLAVGLLWASFLH